MTAETIPCTRCGDFIDPNAATYNNDGELVCKACDSRDQINEGDNRAANSAIGIAAGAFTLSVVSVVFNPCCWLSVLATLTALSSVKVLANPNHRKRLGWRLYPTTGLILLALLLAVGLPILQGLADLESAGR
mgnify:CR=1 FL=1